MVKIVHKKTIAKLSSFCGQNVFFCYRSFTDTQYTILFSIFISTRLSDLCTLVIIKIIKFLKWYFFSSSTFYKIYEVRITIDVSIFEPQKLIRRLRSLCFKTQVLLTSIDYFVLKSLYLLIQLVVFFFWKYRSKYYQYSILLN